MLLWRQRTFAIPGSLGFEWDMDADNGFRPAGAFQLSTSTCPYRGLSARLRRDYGAGTATHHMMMYERPAEHLSLGAGTID